VLRGEEVERLEELHLGREILAPVRHVNRADGQTPELRRDDPVLVVECRVIEVGTLGKGGFSHVQRDSRVALPTVPVAPVAFEVAQPERELVDRCFDLLQAQNVGLLLVDQFMDLRLSGADPVHVPGGNL
jgi:hypothetical protein